MFDEYEDVIDLVMAVRESEFDCSDFATITAFTAWGFCTLYPKPKGKENKSFTISYLKLLEVLDLAVPPAARKISHEISVEKEQQTVYGEEGSPIEIFINKFPDKMEMLIFVAYTPQPAEASAEAGDGNDEDPKSPA